MAQQAVERPASVLSGRVELAWWALQQRSAVGQGVRFACVGVLSTVFHLGLFALLDQRLAAQVANVAALLLSTIGNTALNRRWTFGVTGRGSATRQHAQSLLVFGVAWALSAGVLWLLPLVWSHPTTPESTGAVAVSMVGSTALRFVAMRRCIFRS
jgi:putative flippase GtrA